MAANDENIKCGTQEELEISNIKNEAINIIHKVVMGLNYDTQKTKEEIIILSKPFLLCSEHRTTINDIKSNIDEALCLPAIKCDCGKYYYEKPNSNQNPAQALSMSNK